VKFINGSTAQTLFFIGTMLVRVDGTSDLNRVTNFIHSTAALGISASFTGTTLDLGGNHEIKNHLALVYADQAGTLYLEQSRDGSTWRITNSVAVSAGTVNTLSTSVHARYQRVRYVNGATAQGSFELLSTLSE
jgi:hypothetical protein